MKRIDERSKNDYVGERNSLFIPGRLSPWETSSRIDLVPKPSLGISFRSALVVKVGTDSVLDLENVSVMLRKLAHLQKMRPAQGNLPIRIAP